MFTGTRPRLCKNRPSLIDKWQRLCSKRVGKVPFPCTVQFVGEILKKWERNDEGIIATTWKVQTGLRAAAAPAFSPVKKAFVSNHQRSAPSKARKPTHAAGGTQWTSLISPGSECTASVKAEASTGCAGRRRRAKPGRGAPSLGQRLHCGACLKLLSLSSGSLSALAAGWTRFLKTSPAKHGAFSVAHREDTVATGLLWSRGEGGQKNKIK